NVEIGDNLDAGNQRLRQHAGRCHDRPQQTVDAHANHKPGLERLDMNVARAQLDRLLQEIVDGANHRRAAGKVAQALDVVLARKQLAGQIRRLGNVFTKAAVEHDREVFDRGNLDRDIPT